MNSIVEFFRPPKEVNLAQLTSATLTKLEEFRDKTATGKNASINFGELNIESYTRLLGILK